MNTLEAAVGRVLDLTAREAPDGDELMEACQAVLQHAQRAPADRVGDALSRMTVALRHEHPQVAGLVAICSGALVENGAPAALLGRPLLDRLPAVLSAAGAFVSAVYEAMPEPEGDGEGEGEEDEDDEYPKVEVRGRRVPPEVLGPVFERDLFSVLSYLSLEQWCFPSIACLTRDRAIRDYARSRPELFEMALLLAGANHSAQCLFKALAVFDDEPLLVLHPGEGKGYRMRFGGIADNFQLHVLLADSLIGRPALEEKRGLWARLTGAKPVSPIPTPTPGRLTGERPDSALVATWRGDGPQQVGEPSQGVWNLYQWTAVRPNVTLPDHDMTGDREAYGKHWVWNEGIPWDIPLFEGTRVLLLGPASYVRSFNTARFFDALPATLTVEAELSAEEVASWMRRFAAAARPPELADGETGSPAWK